MKRFLCFALLTAAATVAAAADPDITTQPQNLTNCPGTTAIFNVVATGNTTLSFQWYTNDVALGDGGEFSGSGTDTLTISPVTAADALDFSVVVTDTAGSITSSIVTLTLHAVTDAGLGMADQARCPGENVTFTSTVTGDNLNYEWKKDGTVLSGETGSSFTTNGIGASAAGVYSVEVTGACGNATNSATLTVHAVTDAGLGMADQARCPGENVTFTSTVTGDNLNYEWKKDGAVLSGETGSSFTTNGIGASAAGVYSVEVTGACGNATNSATLTVHAVTDAGLGMADQARCPGENVTFTSTVTGDNLNYEWKKDGTVLDGETGSSFTTNGIGASAAGVYSVEVTGACGNATNSATLTVHAVTDAGLGMADQARCPGENVTFTSTVTGDNLNYEWKKDGAVLSGETGSSFTTNGIGASAAGVYSVEVTGACGNATNSATLTVHAVTDAGLGMADQARCPGENVTFTSTVTGDNLNYEWKKDGTVLDGETGSSFTTNGIGASAAGVYSVEVTGACGNATNSATLTVHAVTDAGLGMADQARCPGENVTFTSTVTGDNLNYEWKKDGVVLDGETGSSFTTNGIGASAAGVYSVEVTGACGNATNSATLTVHAVTDAGLGMADQARCPGENVTFTSTVTGDNLNYEWKKDGTVLDGETGSSFTTNGIGAGAAGVYSVEVTGACGNATNSATLTVHAVTDAGLGMADQARCPGENVTFTSTVTGDNLNYEWKKDGVVLDGETGSSFTTNGIGASAAGVYSVEVTGACGNATNSATLTVHAVTDAGLGMADQARCPGENVTFTSTVTGDNLNYEWKKDGVVLDGETGSSFTTNGIGASAAGVYSVEVTGACGNATNSATLTVHAVTDAGLGMADQARCPSENVTFTSTVTGDNLNYEWKKDGAVLSGETGSSFTTNGIGASAAGVYSVEVTGACGNATNSATLTVHAVTDAGLGMADQARCPGENVTFTSTVTGDNLNYEWKKDGVVLDGETGSSITTNGIGAGAAGVYSVEVTGACGNATNSATLTVHAVTDAGLGMADQARCPGENVTFTSTVTGDNLNYEWKKDGVVLDGETGSSFTTNGIGASAAGVYSVEVTGACGNATNSATLTVHAVTDAGLGMADQARCPGENVTFTSTVTGDNLNYEWKKDGTVLDGETGSSITTNGIGAGAAGVYSVEVTGACGNATNSATLTVHAVTDAGLGMADQARCPGENVTFTSTVTGDNLNYEWKKDGAVLSGETGSSFTTNGIGASAAGVYSVEVTGACGNATNSATLTVNTVTSATGPDNQTNCPGTTAVFNTVASGTGPFTYQWYTNGVALGDGGEFSGSASDTLTVSPVTGADALSYSVVVSGACGSVSNSATLTVNAMTSATALTSLTRCPGAGASFSTTASGTGPFDYVWKKDGNVLAGETGNSFTTNNVSAGSAGTYTVEVSGACGSPVITSAALTVNTVTSATGPDNQTNCPGTTAVFNTVASGTGPFTYQWYTNGVALGDGGEFSGSASDTLTVSPVTGADALSYSVVVSGACGSVSNSATLTVNAMTSATALTSLTRCPGAGASFSTTASGTGPFTYVWKKDGNVLAGETGNSFTTNNVSAGSAGTYTVEVSGACGSPVITSAALTVNTVTSATGPGSQTNCPGTTAVFSTVASGTGPFTYQWYTNGVALGDGGEFNGSASDTLTVSPVTGADALSYSVVVSGACGSVTNSATLTVNAMTSATALTSLTRCPGAGASFSTTASGTGPFDYVWKKDGNVLAGETGNSFTTNNVSAGSAGTYTVEVSGACGSPVITSATLTVSTGTSATGPGSQTNCPGTTAVFSTVASGTGPFTYQWYTNGVALGDGGEFSGSASDTLTVSPVTGADALSYSVVVSGACGSVTNSATLTVNAITSATALTSLTQCSGTSATFRTTPSGTGPFTYVWKKDGNVLAGETGNSFTTNNVSAGSAGTYTVEVSGACGSPVITSATLTVSTGTSASSPSSQTNCPGTTAVFSTVVSGTGPFTYQWYTNGVAVGDGGEFSGSASDTLTVSPVTGADALSYSVVVGGACNSVTESATLTVNTVTSATALTSLTNCPGGSATFTTTASGTGPFSFVWKKDGNVISTVMGTQSSAIHIVGAGAGNYTVEVSGACGSVTNGATLTVNTPVAATPLTSSTNCPGTSATFSTIASGTGPFSYVWTKDGNVLTGETNSSFTTNNVTAPSAGTYAVAVTGACGTVSNGATLTVNVVTSMSGPANRTNCPGTSATFIATPSGTGPFSYVWRKDGNLMAGATNSSFTTNNVAADSAGTYTVEVTGACGSVTNSASLTVNVVTGASALTDVVACPGTSVTFLTAPTGTGPFNYVWRKDGAFINGATDRIFTTNNVSISSAGTYTVEVRGACGGVTNSATLTIKTVTVEGTVLYTEAGGSPFAVGHGPSGIWLGNLRGDKTFRDMAVANSGDNTVSVLFFLGAGNYATAGTYSVGNNPQGVMTWDLNGAGRDDILTANYGSDNITVLINLGGGLNFVARNFAVGHGPQAVSVMDAGGDLIPDVIVANKLANSVSVLLGAGGINFSNAVNYPVGLAPNSITPAELTGDTNQDILTANSGDDTLTILPGLGHGAFDSANRITVSLPANGRPTYALPGSDNGVTNDLIAVALDQIDEVVIVHRNGGSWAYTPGTDEYPLSGHPQSLLMRDVNSDGIPDVTVALANVNKIAVWLGSMVDGTYRLVGDPLNNGNAYEIGVCSEPTIVVGSRLNGTTATDLAVTDAGANTVSVLLYAATLGRPGIAAPPASRTNDAGTTATFTVQISSGTVASSYRWLKNGTNHLANGGNVSGATTATLSLANVLKADEGAYTVVITNAAGSVTSSPPAMLTVIDPKITLPPASRTNLAGTTATFTVGTAGTAPISYRWRKNGSDLADVGNVSGSATASLTLTNVQDADAASYTVRVTNTTGSATSSAAVLTVLDPPAITQSPSSLETSAGMLATFTGSASGTDPLSYQWIKNGTNHLADDGRVLGTATPKLSIFNALKADEGSYSLVVSNSVGSAVSSNAVLTVIDPAIVTQPASRTNDAGTMATFTVVANGTAPMSYQWIKNETNFLADGGNIAGAASATLSISNVLKADEGSYVAVAYNAADSVGSIAVTLTVIEPVIVNQPTNQAVVAGSNATFAVVAAGTAPQYQWRLNGTNLDGALSATLVITNASLADDGGVYSAVVSNSFGVVTSSNATLTVGLRPAIATQPRSQVVPAGSNVTLTVVADGTPAPAYQWFFNSSGISGAVGASLTITNFQSASQGDYFVRVSNIVGSVTSDTAAVYLDWPLIFVNASMSSNGWFQTRLAGLPGSNLVIQVSSNLSDWTSLTTNSAPNGILDFMDTNSPGYSNRFYRGMLAP